MPQDPRVDAYIAGKADFARPLLTYLRERIHAVCPAAEESIKWGMPFFSYRGRPMMNMAAFKAHASFGFWDRSALATGREGEAMGQYGRITSRSDLPLDGEIDTRIREAMALIDSGERPKRPLAKSRPEVVVPLSLAAALANDAAANATFAALSPGQRREYCDWIADARRDETRDKRVADAVQWLREGKRRNWKYENC